jgi:hypothetical protein
MELLELVPDDLGGDLARRVRKLLHSTWPEDAAKEGDYYRNLATPTAVVILRDASEVFAHLAIYEREVGVGSETLEIGMLGGIVVAPNNAVGVTTGSSFGMPMLDCRGVASPSRSCSPTNLKCTLPVATSLCKTLPVLSTRMAA